MIVYPKKTSLFQSEQKLSGSTARLARGMCRLAARGFSRKPSPGGRGVPALAVCPWWSDAFVWEKAPQSVWRRGGPCRWRGSSRYATGARKRRPEYAHAGGWETDQNPRGGMAASGRCGFWLSAARLPGVMSWGLVEFAPLSFIVLTHFIDLFWFQLFVVLVGDAGYFWPPLTAQPASPRCGVL